MAPIALKKLTALQTAYEVEISNMRMCFLVKSKETPNKNIVRARLGAVREFRTEVRKTHSEIIVREDAETDPYFTDHWFERIHRV